MINLFYVLNINLLLNILLKTPQIILIQLNINPTVVKNKIINKLNQLKVDYENVKTEMVAKLSQLKIEKPNLNEKKPQESIIQSVKNGKIILIF